MFFLVFAFLFLASSVLGAEDPTKICFPDQLETTVYSYSRNEAARAVYDFANKIVGLNFPWSGRFIYNLTDGSSFRINDTDNTCERFPANKGVPEADAQCFPASAVLLTNSSRLGLPQDGLDTEAWEVETPNVITRTILIRGPPAIPVLRKIELGDINEILFYFNQSLTITDSAILTVPPVCRQATVVG